MLHPMLHVVAQAVATTDGKNEHWPSTYWLVLGVPLAFYMACSLLLNAFGHSDHKNPIRYFFDSISDALERMTGVAGWAMAGVLTGLLFLLVAAIGLYWDVSWHVDFGRDIGTLFTPPHVTILFGLGGLIFASVISIAFATAQEAPTKLRYGNLRIPYGGLLLGVMGFAAIAAFPLDNLWHWAYGLDVTLWSPTHLQLVTGGSMGTFAVVLLLAEALPFSKPKPFGRFWMVVACGALLTAATTYTGEFDFRVPQFNPIYLPILTMAAAGFALVFSRIALGKWGAVKAAVAFLVIRTVVSGLVASLHHEFAMFPLYLPSALAVEAAAWWIGTENRLKFGLAAGALVGTVGLIGETIWYSVSGWFPAGPNSAQLILPTIILATPAAIAAAVLGAGLGKAFRKGTGGSMPVGALVAAGAVLLTALFIPLPRNVLLRRRVVAGRRHQAGAPHRDLARHLVRVDADPDHRQVEVHCRPGQGKLEHGIPDLPPGGPVHPRPRDPGGRRAQRGHGPQHEAAAQGDPLRPGVAVATRVVGPRAVRRPPGRPHRLLGQQDRQRRQRRPVVPALRHGASPARVHQQPQRRHQRPWLQQRLMEATARDGARHPVEPGGSHPLLTLQERTSISGGASGPRLTRPEPFHDCNSPLSWALHTTM